MDNEENKCFDEVRSKCTAAHKITESDFKEYMNALGKDCGVEQERIDSLTDGFLDIIKMVGKIPDMKKR